jgi:hypothetical protein
MNHKTLARIQSKIRNLLHGPIAKYKSTLGFEYRFTVYYKNSPNLLSELCDVYGSDKGSLNTDKKPFPWKPHSYTDYYEHLFASKKDLVTKVFECGIGTNNVNLPSNMTASGKPGASLRVWRDYFENAIIYGADIDRDILFQESRIITNYINQLDPISIAYFWTSLADNNFDVMIDDGLHTFIAGITLFENSIKYLAQNGTYIIEDVYPSTVESFQQYFAQTSFKVEFVSFNSPKSKFGDTFLISIRR